MPDSLSKKRRLIFAKNYSIPVKTKQDCVATAGKLVWLWFFSTNYHSVDQNRDVWHEKFLSDVPEAVYKNRGMNRGSIPLEIPPNNFGGKL